MLGFIVLKMTGKSIPKISYPSIYLENNEK
jgi:hypothetical protein